MFKMSFLAAAVVLVVGCQKEEANAANVAVAPEAVVLKTEDEKAAYAIGASLGQYLKTNLEQQEQLGLMLNSTLVLQGVQDAFADKSQLTEEETQTALQALDKRVAEKVQLAAKEKSAAAMAEGEKFRAEFAKKAGVTTTDSGLMYEVITEGKGAKPAAENTVVVHLSLIHI